MGAEAFRDRHHRRPQPPFRKTPSKEDIIVTRKIVEAAKIMDIIVVDHIIVGKNRYYSFLENKKL